MTVYVAGSRSTGNKTTWKLNSAGSTIWDADHGGSVFGIAVDSDTDAVATVGNVVSSVTTRYYNSEGTQQWTANHGGQTRGIVFDADGNVFTNGSSTSSICLRQYDSSGTELWTDAGIGTQGYAAFVNSSDGFVYFTGAYSSGNDANYIRFPSDLAYSNSDALGQNGTITDIDIDSSGYVYISFLRGSFTYTIFKLDSSFTQQWNADHGDNCYSIAVDSSGNVYIGGTRSTNSGNYSFRKYNSSGTLQWSKDTGATVFAVAVDDSSNIWVAGAYGSSYNLRKYDPDGTLLSNYLIGDSGVTLYSLVVRPDPPAEIPALSIPLSLGTPTVGGTIDIPALSIPLSLGIPTVTAPASPPDPFVFTLPPQSIYRCVLTGGNGVEVPLQSFQCRRRAGESTWLSVVCPQYTAALEASISSRIDQDILILSGVRAADGTETLGQFIRAVLTEYEVEISPFRGIITLTGRVVPTSRAAISRTLAGVEQRGVDTENRRVVVCAVDPLLKTGDTVTDDGDSFEVGALQYIIGPFVASMTVTEA